MRRTSLYRMHETLSKCLKMCRKLKLKYRAHEERLNRLEPEDIKPSSDNPISIANEPENTQDFNAMLPELSMNANYIGYMTICSSVQTSGSRPVNLNSQQSVKKDALGGVTLDVARLEKYLLKLGQLVHRQAKYEYSAESLSASSKEEFLNSLIFFYNNIRNNGCLIFYSGHGQRDTSLIFETAVENYHVSYDDIISRWKSRTNHKNLHLFVLLDCCYSGSWVIELFRNGDFRNISIQASSTHNQKSNDLGPDIGSLFTTMITTINGLDNKIDLSDTKITQGKSTQTPMAFCSKRGVSLKIFGKVGFNSWLDLTAPCSYKKIISTNGVSSVLKEIPCMSEDLFEFAAIIITKDSLLLEGEFLCNETQKKKISFITTIKKVFPSNMVGCVSIWTQDGFIRGIFFREYKSKRYAFEVPNEPLTKSVSLLKQWIEALECCNSADADISKVNDSLKLLTELNKNNLINLDEYSDEHADIDINTLKVESLSPLEILELSGKIDSRRLRSLMQYMGSSTSALKSLKLENITCDIQNCQEINFLDSFETEISKDTPLETFTTLINKMSFSVKKLTITFTNSTEEIALAHPLLYTNLPFSTNLAALSLKNVYSAYYDDILYTVSNSLSLSLISLEDCDFQMSQANILLHKILSNHNICSVTMSGSNLSTMVEPHKKITYLNLSKNKLISVNIKPLLKVKFVSRYSIDLSYNLINPNLLPDLSAFFKNNKLCEEFNLSGNHLSNDILSLVRMNLISKCTVAVLNLCETDLSNCDFKCLSDLLNKAKQLRHLNLNDCKLTQNQILEVMSLLNDNSISSITSVDISHNKITDESVLHTLRRRVKYSKSLQRLIMIDCVSIVNSTKPISVDGFFTGQSLSEINYSFWKAQHGFDATTQITKTIKTIILREFCFSDTSILNLESLQVEHLEIDNDRLHLIVLPSSCISLKIHHINSKFKASSISLLSQVHRLYVSGSSNILNEFVDDFVAQSQTSEMKKEISSLPFQLDLLMTQEIDQEATTYITELITANPQIQKWEVRKSDYECIAEQLGIVSSYLSDELLDILIKRNFINNNGCKSIHSSDNQDEQLHQSLKCISLIGNCFNTKLLLNAQINALEILELNSVFLKAVLPAIETFVFNNPSLKVLICKDSEINADQINSLCRIIRTLSLSIEELHLVNTFIDSREIKPLLTTLQSCRSLTTLNLSGNSISKKLIFELAASHEKLDTIILRDCAFTKIEVIDALTILNVKSMKMIDISKMRLGEYAVKRKIQPTSRWDLASKSLQNFALEIGYSTKAYNSSCIDQMQVLHLNQINFDENSWLVRTAIRSITCIPVVILTRCLDENSFMMNFYLLTRYTKINILDLSDNLMTETNTKFVIAFLENQLNALNTETIKVSLSKANLEDKCFELIFDFVCMNEKSSQVSIDLSYNKLSKISKTLIELLPQNKCKIFCLNSQGAFSAALNEEELKKKHFYQKNNSKDDKIDVWNKLGFENSHKSKEVAINGHQNYVRALIKLNDDQFASGSNDKTIKLWQVSTATCLKTFIGHKDYVLALVKLSDNLIASGSADSTIKIWQVSTAKCLNTLTGHKNTIWDLISLIEDKIVSGSADYSLRLWKVSSAECLKTFNGHKDRVMTLVKVNDDLIASGSCDNTIKIWRISTTECLNTLTDHCNWVMALVKLSDDLILSGSDDNLIKLWKVSTSSCIKTFEGHKDCVRALDKLSDDLIVSGSNDHTIKLWQVGTSSCIKTFTGHKNNLNAVIALSDNLIASGASDSTIKLWEIHNEPQSVGEISVEANQLMTLNGHSNHIRGLIKIDEDKFLSSSYDNTIKLWQISTKTCLKTFVGHKFGVFSIAKINNDKFVTGSDDNTIKLWSVSTGSCLLTLTGHNNAICALIKLTEDLIISGCNDNTIKLWQISNASCLKTITGHLNWISSLVKMGSDLIVSGSYDNTIKLWQLSSSLCLKTLEGHKNWVMVIIKMSEDLILSGSSDCTIKLWQVSTSKNLETFEGHTNTVWTLAKLSNDLIISGSYDKTIKLWQLSNSKCLKTLAGHTNWVLALLKMSDDLIISGSSDRSIKCWKLS